MIYAHLTSRLIYVFMLLLLLFPMPLCCMSCSNSELDTCEMKLSWERSTSRSLEKLLMEDREKYDDMVNFLNRYEKLINSFCKEQSEIREKEFCAKYLSLVTEQESVQANRVIAKQKVREQEIQQRHDDLVFASSLACGTILLLIIVMRLIH